MHEYARLLVLNLNLNFERELISVCVTSVHWQGSGTKKKVIRNEELESST